MVKTYDLKVRLLYISISEIRGPSLKPGDFAHEQGDVDFEPSKISDASADTDEVAPYFALVPTYLDGGNGYR